MLLDLRAARRQLRRVATALKFLHDDAVALGADPAVFDFDLGITAIRAQLEQYRLNRRVAIRGARLWRAARRRAEAPAIVLRAGDHADRTLRDAEAAFDEWRVALDRVWWRLMSTADFVIDTYAYEVEDVCADPAEGRQAPAALH